MKASFLTYFHSDADRLLFSVNAHSLYFLELLQVTFDHFSLFLKILIGVWVMANHFSIHGSGKLVDKVSLYKTIGWWFVEDTLEYLKVHLNFFCNWWCHWWLITVTLVGWFWVSPHILGDDWDLWIIILLENEGSLSGGENLRWWGHSNPT